jgi:hypothetical protein
MTLQISWSSLRPIAGSYQQLSPTTATPLTPPAGAAVAVMTATTASVRYRDDGTAPDATHGVVIPSGVAPFYYAGDLSKIQFISATGVLDVLYYATN